MTCRAGLLGPIEAHRETDGETDVLNIGGARQRRLLAYLALAPGRSRSLDGIIGAMWPDGNAPLDARQSVHTAISRLRAALGDASAVVARGGGYSLEGIEVDSSNFTALFDQVRNGKDPSSRSSALRSALELWRGPALEEFAHEEWARSDAVRLDELRAHVADEFGVALLESGDAAEAVVELESAAARSPLRERTHRILMEALSASGRQAEALRVFQTYRHRLSTDLGLEPGDDMSSLERSIAAGSLVPRAAETVSLDRRSIRSYELGAQIGHGAFAVVYQGIQPSVGREVAVKVIRAELANQPEFIRRFETEAHLVARLEHPYIVPLYDFWREPGSAYLVMRWLRGGTLEQRLRNRPLSVDEASRFVTQVASALDAAHRLGVVHRDVRPANVLLDGEGNYFLGDFGIATDVASEVASRVMSEIAESTNPETKASSLGSPAYAAPEQLRREPVGPQTDIYGLGIALYECFTGRLPFGDARTQDELIQRQLHDPVPSACSVRPELPAGVDVVIQKATAKVAADRYHSVTEFADELARIVSSYGVREPELKVSFSFGPLRNPFKGLRSFHEADAPDFFGRERLVKRLLDALRHSESAHTAGLLAVVGPSGSGKSSVVRAGLLPALRAGAIDGSDQWFVTSMLPGAHPFEELEVALDRVSVNAVPLDVAALRAPRGISRAVKRLLREDTDLVLVIDQFEELFTLCEDPDEQTAFLDGLVEALSDPSSRIRLVVTLRADFYDRPLRHPELARLLERGTVAVGSLLSDELERAITAPVFAVGASFEPGLVTRIVAEVVNQPSALPLLQYALTELFDRNVDGVLSLRTYEEFGGLGGAIAASAERLVASGVDEELSVRRMFTRLVTLGEGSEDTRRRVLLSEFDRSKVIREHIDRFGAARLLTFDRDPASREPTVELAHEALISEWPRLKEWVNEDRDGLRLLRHLSTTATAWANRGREESELYRGGRLELAERYGSEHHAELNEIELEFLASSSARAQVEAASKRRGEQRIRKALVAVAGLALVSIVAGSLAWNSRQRARVSAETAETSRLAASAPALAQTSLQLGLLAAAESYRRDQTPETLGALQRALVAQDRILGILGAGRSYLAVGIEGDTVYGLRQGSIDRWDVTSLEEQSPLTIPARPILDPTLAAFRLRFSVGRGFAAVRYGNASSILVDLSHGSIRNLPSSIRSVVSPDGSRVLVIHPNHAAELLDTSSLKRVWLTKAPTERTFGDQMKSIEGPPAVFAPATPLLTDAAFLPNGDPVIARTWRLLRLDAATGRTVAEFAKRFASPKLVNGSTMGGVGASTWLVVEGDHVVGASIAMTAAWNSSDLSLASQAFTWRGNPFSTAQTSAVASLSKGTALVAHGDGSVVTIDTTTGLQRETSVDTQIGGLWGLATNSARTRAVVAGDQGVAVMSLNGDRLLARAIRSDHSFGGVGGALGVGGTRVFIEDAPQTGTDAQPLIEALCPTNPTRPCRIVPSQEADVSELWGGSRGRVVIWDRVNDRAVFQKTQTHPEFVVPSVGWAIGTVLAPSSASWVALASRPTAAPRSQLLRVVDSGTGAPLYTEEIPGTGWDIVAPPDGNVMLLFNRTTGDSISVDTTKWRRNALAPFIPGTVSGGVFNRSGKRLLTVARDGTYTLRAWPGGAPIRTYTGDNSLSNNWSEGGVEFFEDDQHVVSVLDTVGRLWDLDVGRPIGGPFPSEPGSQSYIVPGKVPILLTHVPGKALVWDLDTTRWFDLACKAAGRNMTPLEWASNGPRDKPYRATCPQWPAQSKTSEPPAR